MLAVREGPSASIAPTFLSLSLTALGPISAYSLEGLFNDDNKI